MIEAFEALVVFVLGIFLTYQSLKAIFQGALTWHITYYRAGRWQTYTLHANQTVTPFLFWLLISTCLMCSFGMINSATHLVPDSESLKDALIIYYGILSMPMALDVCLSLMRGKTIIYLTMSPPDDPSSDVFKIFSRVESPVLYWCILTCKVGFFFILLWTAYIFMKYGAYINDLPLRN